MRNLRNLGHWFQNAPEDQSGPCVCAWDTSNNDVICAFGPTSSDTLVSLQRWTPNLAGDFGILKHIASWDAPCPSPDLDCDRILDIRHFSDNLSTCIVFAGGDVVVVRESPLPDQDKIEILGSVDVGIAAAAWAPDEELLVILTNAATLLYMSREFESITDVSFTRDDLKASKHVSVGWGKAETQFRGKGAKALRDPTMPEKVDQGLKSSHDNDTANISWRGDGAYVAVNSRQESDRRVIRIYSREGALDGVTEPVDNLESALSWRPSGNLIAGVQRFDDRIDVVFFERNGLRHGQFSLRLTAEQLKTRASSIELNWNQDSTILAVCLADSVQLWTMGNYHYYLKQEMFYDQKSLKNSLPYFSWHAEQPLLFAIGHQGRAQISEHGWRMANGTNLQPYDIGLSSVIDGKILKITPLKLANIPPPMALFELEVSDNILDVAYCDITTTSQPTVYIAVLSVSTISIYTWDMRNKPLPSPILLSEAKLDEKVLRTLSVRQIGFSASDEILLLADSNDTVGSQVMAFQLTGETLSLSRKLPSASHTRELLPFDQSMSNTTALWHTRGKLDQAFATNPPETASNLDIVSDLGVPTALQSLAVIRRPNGEDITFGLKKNGALYVSEECVAKDCTSFLVTSDHLIFTTSQHLLKFVHLIDPIDTKALEVPPDTPEVDERCRAIERGAKLVNVVPSTSALILQMPRGNLETIYPRALVIPVIRNHISCCEYKKAFLMCRNHRVDMNILHDHAPDQFLSSIDIFINQVKKVEHIDLFLAQLREEDVSVTMYKDTLSVTKPLETGIYPGNATVSKQASTSKVNRICIAFLDALSTHRSSHLQNIISAHVCQNPPALEDGLQEIANLRSSSPNDVDRAVEHICFLADVNRLFDTALGMYDLDMTLLIAQQSQRDPREYLPFLQKLKEQEKLRMRVDIDNHLRRYSKVLIHYQELDDFATFKKHTIKHELYEQAIEMCKYQESRLHEIMQSYAEYLETKSRHKDAGIAYEYLKNYKPAAESYRLAHMWQEALSCAALVPLSREVLQEFASAMAESLIELKDYRAAATIHLEYLNNVESAARLLCKGYYFADATMRLSLHNRQDLFETVIDTGLAEGQAAMTELLAEMKSQLNAQVPRIRELRIKKAEEPLSFYDADVANGADVPDNVSLAGTDASTVGGTLFTRYTNRTGTVATNATRATHKRKMREERKRARGKKGSVYEEEYLINSVARLFERVNTIGEEVQRLIIGLMRRGMRERARAVENAMLEVIKLCAEYSPEVFQSAAKEVAPEPIEKPGGGEGVMWESMEQAQTPRDAPIIKAFEKLSILGA